MTDFPSQPPARTRVLTRLLAAGLAVALAGPLSEALLAGDSAAPDSAPQAAEQDPSSRPDPAGPGLLPGYEALDCFECHAEITREWAGTYHAHAWVHARYQDEIKKKRRPQSCHGCHIPVSLGATDLARKPKPRKATDEPLHLGVSCASCHLGQNGVLLGPYGAPTEAHASQASRLFRDTSDGAPTPLAGSNELCASCHRTTIGPVIGVAKDFELTDQVARGRSCVGCHMDVEYRSMATWEGQPTEERMGRSHRLNSPRDPDFLRTAFAVSAVLRDGQTVVTFVNEAGHRVPGLVDRELAFRAEVLDADGASSGAGELAFTSRAHLPTDASRELAIDAAGARVRVVGTHTAADLEAPIRFYDVTLNLE